MGELTCELNPPGIRVAYLQALNQCFPGWGSERQFAWCFEREVGARRADLMVLRLEGELLAGSAVTYRIVRLANGNPMRVGIMTGSWTLPAARGQGCFSRIIEESVGLSRAARGAVLLAFVTEDNASCRRLLAAGSAAFPTRYLVCEAGLRKSEAPVELRGADQDFLLQAWALRESQATGQTRISYTADQWRSQFLERSGECSLLQAEALGAVAVEEVGHFVRVQATALRSGAALPQLLGAVSSFAQARGKGTFLFSLDEAVHRAAEQSGFTSKPGLMTALVADAPALCEAVGVQQPWSGLDSRALADPSSPWHLGPWFLESGDRM